MKLLSKFKIPYSDDKAFGFLLVCFITVTFGTITIFSVENSRMILWSICLGMSLFFTIRTRRLYSTLPVTVIVSLFVMWVCALAATFLSLDHINSIFGIDGRMTGSIWFFSLWVITVFLLTQLEKNKLAVLLKLWVILGGIASFWAILQYFGIGFYGGIEPPVRALVPSFFGNPNFAGMFVATTIFITLWYVISPNFTSRIRVFAFLCLGLNLFSLVIFASRGAILGTLLGLGLLFVFYLLKQKWKIALGLVILILIFFGTNYSYLNAVREQTIVNVSTDVSSQQRWYLWDDVIQNIIHHPVVGTGLGNYFLAFRQNESSYFAFSQWFDDAHNLTLQLAVTGGVQLALIFLIIIALVVWNLYQRYKKFEQDEFIIFLSVALVSWLFASSFNPVTISNWFILALLIALSFQHLPLRQINFGKITKTLGLVLVVIFIFTGLIFLGSEIALTVSSLGKFKQNTVGINFAKSASYLNPTNMVAINTLAQKQFNSKDYDQSYQTYLRLEKLHPQSSLLLIQSSLGYLRLYEATKDDKYRRAILSNIPIILQNFNTNSQTHYNVAVLYSRLGEYDKALLEAKETIIRSNQSPNSWLFLAEIYGKLDQPDNRHKALKRACALSPEIKLRRELARLSKNDSDGQR